MPSFPYEGLLKWVSSSPQGLFNSGIPGCCFLSLLSLLFLLSSCQEWAPRQASQDWGQEMECMHRSPFISFSIWRKWLFTTLFWYRLSFGFMASITPCFLVTCKGWPFDLYLKKLPCNMVYILTQSSIKHPCSARDLGPRVLLSPSLPPSLPPSLSLSLSLSVSGWFSERGNLTSSFSCPGFQDLFGRAPCAYMRGISPVLGL